MALPLRLRPHHLREALELYPVMYDEFGDPIDADTTIQYVLDKIAVEMTDAGREFTCPKCGGDGTHQRLIDIPTSGDTTLIQCTAQTIDGTVKCDGFGATDTQLKQTIPFPIQYEVVIETAPEPGP